MTRRSPRGAPMAFLREVVAAPPTDDCVEWPYARSPLGYGRINIGGRSANAHAVVLELSVGPRPGAWYGSLHSCDNPPCVNPRHLRWGTAAENRQDQVDRDRFAKGEKQAGALLTEAGVRLVRQLTALGFRQVDLASAFGVSRTAIGDAVAGRRWAWLEQVDFQLLVDGQITHCVQGHPFDEANTYIQPSNGRRQCRACKREFDLRKRAA